MALQVGNELDRIAKRSERYVARSVATPISGRRADHPQLELMMAKLG